MERHHPSQEEVADLVRRSEMPAAIWAAFLVAACMSAVFDEGTEPGASKASPVCPASSAYAA